MLDSGSSPIKNSNQFNIDKLNCDVNKLNLRKKKYTMTTRMRREGLQIEIEDVDQDSARKIDNPSILSKGYNFIKQNVW